MFYFEDGFLIMLGIVLIIAIYVVFCKILNNLVRHKNGRDYFWYIFLFGPFFGVALGIVLDYRDKCVDDNVRAKAKSKDEVISWLGETKKKTTKKTTSK